MPASRIATCAASCDGRFSNGALTRRSFVSRFCVKDAKALGSKMSIWEMSKYGSGSLVRAVMLGHAHESFALQG
jgi:hypothetical protein